MHMKKIIIICMTTYCYLACMHNSTATILQSNGPCCNNGPLAVYAYNNPVMSSFTIPACCGTPNRKERRAQGQRKAVVTTEQKAQNISSIIDEEIVGVTYRGWDDWPAWWLLRQHKLYIVGKNPSDIIQELKKIDTYIQEAHDPKVLPILAEKDAIVKGLINGLTSFNHYFDFFGWPNIKGSTIDVLYDETYVFSSLSSQLSRYITNKIKNKILDKYMSSYRQETRVRPHYQEKTNWFMHTDAACISRRTESAIHSIALEGFEHPIDKTSIEMSRDKRYMRAKDVKNNMLVWDMVTGERCNTNSRQLKNKVWSKKELYETKGPFAEISFFSDEQYHVSACGSKGFFGCKDAETPTLYLYKKP